MSDISSFPYQVRLIHIPKRIFMKLHFILSCRLDLTNVTSVEDLLSALTMPSQQRIALISRKLLSNFFSEFLSYQM